MFNKIENTETEHKAISNLQSNKVNLVIIESIKPTHITTINGKDITIAK